MTANLVPVAQYLRMSTEHQQYSIENQRAMIETYAHKHGFEIVRTYSDPARTGVVLKHRLGLRQLLKDVVTPETRDYKAILVYDISRWGRFQDVDESAHYEFLCKSSGVPVHYCAESFANDGSIPSLFMKSMKRALAAEYSRELGVKVLDGARRLSRLGFKQGGLPGYALRRMLISADGTRKQLLALGERKNIAADRVILVPGPAHELQIVRDIYRMLISERMTPYAISCELNRRQIKYLGIAPWDYQAVHGILTHPKYAGYNLYGRTSSRLYTPTIKLPKTDWILTSSAFEPIVDRLTFLEAQRVLLSRTINKSNEEILQSLRDLLAREKRLSLRRVQNSPDTPSASLYRQRFGSIRRAYELIGYGRPESYGPIDLRQRTQALRDELISRIAEMYPTEVSIVSRSGRWRKQLQMQNGITVSVLIGRAVRVWKEAIRWQIDPNSHERKHITLLVRLNERNDAILDLYVFPQIDARGRFHIRRDDTWLNCGVRVSGLSTFCSAVAAAQNTSCRSGIPLSELLTERGRA
jgi:DNA invertase Pin-like site-specific DNA recombinase